MKDRLILFLKSYYLPVIFIILLVPLYFVLYKIYIPRVAAFGCFDDCFNYLGGYFLANGKHIYKDFFFNHQLIPPFISYLIQEFTSPINIYDLFLRHRQFVLLFGFFFNILLILRFRFPAFFFALLFELSKFYIFGDRFLAEGIIVYPFIYLFGLSLLKLTKRKLSILDYLLSSVFTWFLVFSREPYAPLALFIFATLLIGKIDLYKKTSVAIFGVFSALTLIYIGDLREYYFNLVTFNFQAVIVSEPTITLPGHKILHIFFYPAYAVLFGEENIFKSLLSSISAIFIIYLLILLKEKFFRVAIFLVLALGLANIRPVDPDTLFYEAFHLIIWYGMILFSVFFFISHFTKLKLLRFISFAVIIISFLIFITSKSYFAYEIPDPHSELLTNLGYVLHTGETIKALSDTNDTLFLDRSEDLIYWQSGLLSSYKYVWYTSQMNEFERYEKERTEMFRNSPPDFYKEFGLCPKKITDPNQTLPDFARNDYVRLYSGKDLSCLFVKKSKLKEISTEQWKKANELLYSLTPN